MDEDTNKISKILYMILIVLIFTVLGVYLFKTYILGETNSLVSFFLAST